VKRRANLIVFWGCDPDRDHPGFVSRYCPPRPGRLRIAVDVGEALGPSAVEERLEVAAPREIESLSALRAFVRGRRVESDRAQALGLPLEPLRGLARRMSTCGYGAVLADADPPPEGRDPERAGALGALVRDARSRARLRLVGIRRPGNPVGAENVLTWQTGFPGPVAFGPGGPRYAPGELEGEHVLARGEVDAALVVGAEPERFLSPSAQEGLRRLPTVYVGPSEARGGTADIAIATAPFAITEGHVFRMDGVALRQRPSEVGASPTGASPAKALPTEASVLRAVAEAVAGIARGRAAP
jgi:formylmethanofuran dehydrogenase subunit B